MSRYCVLRTCKEQAGQSVLKGEKTRSHKFPRDEALKAQWENFVNQANHTTDFRGTSQVVCSRHFAPLCYGETGRLLPDAVPTIADRYTLKVAWKYNLLPKISVTSEDLAQLNKFSDDVVQIRECGQDLDDEQWAGPSRVEVHEVPLSRCCDRDDVIIGKEDDPLGEGYCGNNADSNGREISDRYDHRPVCNPDLSSGSRERSLEPSIKREKRKYYPGDLTPSDFESPHQRVHNLIIIQRELNQSRYRFQRIQQKYHRALDKIEKLEEIISQLKKERVRSK